MSPPSFWFIAVLLVAPLVSGCRAPALAQGVRASTAAPERTALSPSDSVLVHRLDALTRRLAAADSFSGVVLLARDGDPIYTFTTGVADRRTGAPNRLDTRFNLASVDKFFTRVAVHQLQEAGRLSTSDLVGRHLPDYPNDRVRDEVTIGHLLSMR
ncbi:MAG TPA: serine hydrolase domain-containing protein, partial [Rubricoccaceae bacterium]